MVGGVRCVRKDKLNSADRTVASLFSGCGGFDIGFEQEGFRPIGAFDIDSHMTMTYNENVAPVATVCDLSTETPQVRPDVRCFIRELLLTFSLSSTTCNSAWVSRGFSVIKHV